MLQIKNSNFKRMGVLAFLSFLASTGIGVAGSSPAEALSPTVTATFMDPVGTTSLQPGQHGGDAGNFYVPVKIDAQDVTSISVSVKAAHDSLIGTNSTNTIAPVPSGTQYTIGQMSNQWGYRWNIGDTIDDTPNSGSNPKNYQQMPTSSTLLDTVSTIDSRDTTVTKYLTLGFGVGVSGATPSDTYTNEVTVSVVATPYVMTIFDITYMQDMTADICYNTTTPTIKTISTGTDINATADGASYTTAIDTTGAHYGDGTYVPQKELIDKRDGKKYTIRKLADGNCWMVSNLEFDLVPTASKNTSTGSISSSAFSTNGTDKVTGAQITLTNEDTDLNSITTWTPAIAAELYGTAGTVYKTQRNAGQGNDNEGPASATTATTWVSDGTDGLRSFSSAAGYPSALYSTKTSSDPAFGVSNTGKLWQRFGNLYNWTAATLGSGTKVTTDGENAEDSICPKGWKLPYHSSNDSFSNLITSTYGIARGSDGANQLANFPLNFLRTGYYYGSNGKLYGRTMQGAWWTATRYSEVQANDMFTSTGFVSPQDSYSRNLGFALRCVAR